MKQPWLDELAPLTFAWGFLEVPLEVAGDAFLDWMRSYGKNVEIKPIDAPLRRSLRLLEPLTGLGRKRLLLPTKSKWTAFFENSAQGGEPRNAAGHLAQVLKCRGLAITCVPNTMTREKERSQSKGTYGAVEFELFGPEKSDFLNYTRSISAANDGGRWRFSTNGTPKPFEKFESYTQKKIADRFTSDLLEDYCKALDIFLFDEAFYGSSGLLISINEPLPRGWTGLTLEQARLEHGF